MQHIDVLHALDYANPDDVGGASHVAFNVTRSLTDLSRKAAIFAGCPEREGWYRRNGLSLCHFPVDASERRILHALSQRFRNPGRVFKRHFPEPASSISLIACHQALIAWNLRRAIRRIPMVYFFHSPWPAEYEAVKGAITVGTYLQWAFRKHLEKRALSRAQLIFTGSEYMRGKLLHYHRDETLESKIHTFPFGVDTNFFKPAGGKEALREKLGLPQDKTILLTIRRLEKRMGIKELIKAFHRCLQKRDDLHLVITGKGPCKTELQSIASRLGLASSILFRGYAPNEELPLLYCAADLFVLPTQELEGFGLVILEALACNCPVIATPVGGIPEVLGPFADGCLTADTTEEAIAHKLLEAVSPPRNAEQNASSAAPFRDYVLKNFSWKKYAERFIAKAATIINKR